MPGHCEPETTTVLRTIEEPCDYRDNAFERYYPVKDKGQLHENLYRRYAQRAAADGQVIFIGRCGTYQYLDMHQVINQSLMHVEKWISQAG